MNEKKSKIEVNHVIKKFKKKTVLQDVSLNCTGGKIYGIVGHNGSGKTVLFKCICGFYHCEQGEILVNGKRMGKEMNMLEYAGIIIEEPGFLSKWDGYHNLEFLYTIRNKSNKKYLWSILERIGLDPHSKMPVAKYSLGMRQRLAIGQAIMEDPDILILDEPMNGLDRNGVEEMRKIFEEMRDAGKLIILASHNKEDIEILCDEVYEMENGILTTIKAAIIEKGGIR